MDQIFHLDTKTPSLRLSETSRTWEISTLLRSELSDITVPMVFRLLNQCRMHAVPYSSREFVNFLRKRYFQAAFVDFFTDFDENFSEFRQIS